MLDVGLNATVELVAVVLTAPLPLPPPAPRYAAGEAVALPKAMAEELLSSHRAVLAPGPSVAPTTGKAPVHRMMEAPIGHPKKRT